MKRVVLFLLLALTLSAPAYEGVVTFSDFRRRVFFLLMANDETIRFTYFGRGPTVGDIVSAEGELRSGSRAPICDKATWRRLGHDESRLPKIVDTSIVDLNRAPDDGGFGVRMNGRAVCIDGLVRTIEKYEDETRVELERDGKTVTAILLAQAHGDVPPFVCKGAVVRVEGIFECFYDFRILPGIATVVNPYVYLSTEDSFTLVSPPTWWTRERTFMVIFLVSGIALASLIWALSLKGIVRRRTDALMAESKARLRAEVESDVIARERMRLSFDLHDDLQQLLAGTMCRLKAGINYLGRHDESKALSQLAFARLTVAQTQVSLRHILWGLHDESQAPGSLLSLFTYVAKRFPDWRDTVSFVPEGEERPVSRQVSGVLLMILQEAVANALKHGAATRVAVRVVYSPHGVALTVSDNGCGFVPSAESSSASHLGLVSMRLRAEQIGGKFTISSKVGEGTTVRVAVEEEVKT